MFYTNKLYYIEGGDLEVEKDEYPNILMKNKIFGLFFKIFIALVNFSVLSRE